MAPDATPPMTPAPPLDGRDVSRIRTEVRLAHLALGGLLGEEPDDPAAGGTASNVLNCLEQAQRALDEALENLGQALADLNEDA